MSDTDNAHQKTIDEAMRVHNSAQLAPLLARLARVGNDVRQGRALASLIKHTATLADRVDVIDYLRTCDDFQQWTASDIDAELNDAITRDDTDLLTRLLTTVPLSLERRTKLITHALLARKKNAWRVLSDNGRAKVDLFGANFEYIRAVAIANTPSILGNLLERLVNDAKNTDRVVETLEFVQELESGAILSAANDTLIVVHPFACSLAKMLRVVPAQISDKRSRPEESADDAFPLSIGQIRCGVTHELTEAIVTAFEFDESESVCKSTVCEELAKKRLPKSSMRTMTITCAMHVVFGKRVSKHDHGEHKFLVKIK